MPEAEPTGPPAAAERQTTRLRERLVVLAEVSQAVARPLDLDELFRVTYDLTARVLDATLFSLGLYDQASDTVDVFRQIHAGVERPGFSFPLGSGFTSQVIRTRQPRLIRRWSLEGPPVQLQYATDEPGLPESGLTVPLVFGDQVIGVLWVQTYRAEAYDEDDLVTLQAIAGQVAVAIEHLRHSERLDVKLRQQVQELEAILANMADALLIVDAAGRIMRLNRAARKLLCVDNMSLVVGQPLDREQWGLWPLGAQALAEALMPMIEALRRGEGLEEVEVELRGDGRRVLTFGATPLTDPAGMLAGGIIVFRDVTGRREVERLKEEMLSIASHDLRTPVAALKGYAQLLLRQVKGGRATADTLAKGLTTVIDQADRLVELLNLLLDLSRLEAGRLELQLAPTDLVALVANVAERVQATTDRHRLVVHGSESDTGNWDERRLEQVLQNLLTNAVKYSPNGGRVEVLVQSDERTATVCVRDEGVGLAPEELPHLFERFYRAEGTRRLDGSGLGLYICQGIIAAHGGRIWAESAGPGRGSSFCFTVSRNQGNVEYDDVVEVGPDGGEQADRSAGYPPGA